MIRKIAKPQDLKAELQRLLSYCQEGNPSRQVLASELHTLAERVAATKLRKLPSIGVTQIWAVMRDDQQIGAVEKNRSTKHSLEPYHAMVGKKTIGSFYDEKEAETKGPQLNEALREKLKWGGLDAAVKAIEHAA